MNKKRRRWKTCDCAYVFAGGKSLCTFQEACMLFFLGHVLYLESACVLKHLYCKS